MTEKYRQRLGKAGEDAACRYLRRRFYRILERNYRALHGEIDIIARRGEYLVFVEVKTRFSDAYGDGLEAVTPQKQHFLRRTASVYLQHLHEDYIPRFDVISQRGKWVGNRFFITKTEHIKEAF